MHFHMCTCVRDVHVCVCECVVYTNGGVEGCG